MAFGDQGVWDAEVSATRRPLHIALISSGDVIPQHGGAQPAEADLVAMLREAVRSRDVVTHLILHSSKKLLSAHTGEVGRTINVRRGALQRVVTPVLSSPIFHRVQLGNSHFPLGFLERRLIALDVDLVVLCSPNLVALDFRSLPFWVSFWDLGHRDLPEFPELALGRRFEIRESQYRRVIPKASTVIVESSISIARLQQIYGLDPGRAVEVRFVPSGFRCSDTHPMLDNPTTKRRSDLAVYPAQFWPHKNHAVLIQAVRLLLDQGRQSRTLVFVGSDMGNERQVRALAAKNGVEEFVQFMGFVPRHDLEELYRSAYVTVFPSLLGPTNLPPLEALSFGCRVATCYSDDPELIADSGVRRVAPHDVEGWADVLDLETSWSAPSINLVRTRLESRRIENVGRLRRRVDQFAMLSELWE